MSIPTQKFIVSELVTLYKVILNHTAKLHPKAISFCEIDEEQVAAYFNHSYTSPVLNIISNDCGFGQNTKGGGFYDIYCKLKPDYQNGIWKWPSSLKEIAFTKSKIDGLIRYIQHHNLESKIKGFDGLIVSLYARFSSNNTERLNISSDNQSKSILSRHQNFWRSENFPLTWKNSSWKCYERTDLGICISVMHFRESGNIITAKLETVYRIGDIPDKYQYSGLASRDQSGEYLNLELFRDDDPHTLASFIMRLSIHTHHLQEISLGYYTYFAIRFRKFVCKQVIWERITDENRNKTEPVEILRKDLNNFNKINPFIRRYLYNKELNRMAIPDDLISILHGEKDSLENMINEKLTDTETDEHLKICHGLYTLSYLKPLKEKNKHDLVFDSLCFEPEDPSLSIEMVETRVVFCHNKNNRYTGKVNLTNDVILNSYLVPFQNQSDFKTKLRLGPVSIYLKLPPLAENEKLETYLKSKVIFGLISGLSDSLQVPVSYKFALTRKLSDHEIKNGNKLVSIIKKELSKGSASLRAENPGIQ